MCKKKKQNEDERTSQKSMYKQNVNNRRRKFYKLPNTFDYGAAPFSRVNP